ncbi:MAG: flagellar basal body P-ring protein FlgI [Planctomycetota bacterium]|nr:flagellar basal body P-ring protein FlgI [Planctomycetota bacterium]MCX8039087.1 flagellar basal body P-ring protein FlgI [Planctomycetota bacterium]MDW8372197.1 flagellar basal body P-ring protein FlgI [Planctomycetota bacterium]
MRALLAFLLCGGAALLSGEADGSVRLKDLCTIDGVRDNQLNGVGIVVGLSGTGDKSPATRRLLRQVLARKHQALAESDLDSRNVALVALTADIPAFAKPGTRVHAQVSAIGDASSLRGGILLQTPLDAWDGKIYAVAQGPVSVGGYGPATPVNAGPVGTDHRNIETVAIIEAIVEREVPASLVRGDRLRLVLRQPDFTTAARVSEALAEAFGRERVVAEDARSIVLRFLAPPSSQDIVEAIARLEELRVQPDTRARVVINARTGTVVVGAQVTIGPVAVSHGGLSLRIQPTLKPNDASGKPQGQDWTDPVTRLRSDQPPPGVKPTAVPGTLNLVEGVTVEQIANALNAIGARPRDLVAIFEAIHRAGALHADLEVM